MCLRNVSHKFAYRTGDTWHGVQFEACFIYCCKIQLLSVGSYFSVHILFIIWHIDRLVEGAFSWYYQQSVHIIYCQGQIRLFVQQVALLTYGFQVRVNEVPLPNTVTAPRRPGPSHYWGLTNTLRHTTVRRTHLDEWSTHRSDLYLWPKNTLKGQACMSPAGF